MVTYDPDSGNFFCLTNFGSYKKGDISGKLTDSCDIEIILLRNVYKAHDLVYFYMKGVWPDVIIDHIDYCKTNNRLENLTSDSW